MIPTQQKQILLTGATGKTGSRIAQKLSHMGYSIRMGSRSANPAFNWQDASTWPAALEGMDAVYIAFQPDLAVPGAIETIGTFIDTAVAAGVRQLVLLSGRGEPEAEQCEQLVMQAGVDWTILRCSWFNQNFSEGYLLEPIVSGSVALPVDTVKEPFIDAEDIADVAVAAFTTEGHSGKLYELTGPRLLTFREAVDEIARATGRSITYKYVPLEPYINSLSGYGMPPDLVQLMEYLFREIMDGRNAYVADGVEQALGRKPTDFTGFVRKTADSGVWYAHAGQST
jgi:uncharacterized protein YbjT (DUF2867 family)